jgi:uncharacterized linocin/CFP29 family protein
MKDLRREQAPITPVAWKRIDDDARDVLRTNLTARQVVDVDGPHGWRYAAVNLGRATERKGVIEAEKGAERDAAAPRKAAANVVRLATRDVLPMIELRVDFRVSAEELRTLDRGADDIDLDSLDEACRALAAQEDRLVFEGLPEVGMQGICPQAVKGELKDTPQETAAGILDGVEELRRRGVDGPYGVMMGPEDYARLAETVGEGGAPLLTYLERLIDGTVLRSDHLEGALVFRREGGDWILTLGRDVSIGYAGHAGDDIDLYLQESLAVRAVDPEAVVHLTR